jgi:Chemotaxis signal transduction protein
MNTAHTLIAFTLDDQRYALHLSAVEKVVHAVEITSLPKAPDIVVGVINVQGRIIAVVDIRKRFGLPQREIVLSDQLIIARASKRPVAMIVNAVQGVIEYSEEMLIPANEIVHGIQYIDGIVKLRDGMVLIHDLEKFLSLKEKRSLDRAMAQA